MNLQIERLKQRSIQFTLQLVQKRFSEDLIIQLINEVPDLENESLLYQDINSKEDLKKLKEFVKSISSKLDKTILEDLKEELREMADDFKWSMSDQGKAVMKLEAWVISAREQLATHPGFENVFIGRDLMDPLLLIVSGVVQDDADGKRLVDLIKEWKPPVTPKYIIEHPATTQ